MISGDLPPWVCGVGDNAYTLAVALRRAGVDVPILTTAGREIANEAGLDVRAAVRSWQLSSAARTAREIRAVDPNLVHLQYPTAVYGAGLLPQTLAFLKVPFVVTIHEASFSHILRRASLYPFLAFADHVIATTRFEADFLARMYPPVRKRLSVISIGSSIPVAEARLRDRETVAYFGLIAPNKGLEDFLALAALVREAGKRWTFRVIGAPPAGGQSYAQELRDSALSFGIEWYANLQAEEVAKHLASVAAVYLPFPDGVSRRRSTALAAMVNGAPVVTTRGRATPHDLIDGENVAFADSPGEAFQKIGKIISDAGLRTGLASGAAEYGEQFSWKEIAERHAALYERLADKER